MTSSCVAIALDQLVCACVWPDDGLYLYGTADE
jgi:hypothetical protein